MITANKPKDQVVIYTIHASDRGSSIYAGTNGEIETKSGGAILWRI
jgi:hypothetical protein